MRYITLLLLILASITVTGTQPLNTPDNDHREMIRPDINRVGVPIVTTTYFYNSIEEVNRAYKRIQRIPNNAVIRSKFGFAVWPTWHDRWGNSVDIPNELWCEIHSLRPMEVNDYSTLVYGHEGLHCLYGRYHRE